MTSSKILFYLCLSFIIGIFLESVVKIPIIFLWVFLFSDFLAIFVFLILKKDALIVVGFCLLFLIIGIMRFQISELNIANDKLSKLNGKGEVVLNGVVFREPDIRENSQKLKIKINDSVVLVTAGRYPEYNYLEKVKLTGKLETPNGDFSAEGGSASGGSYKNYLMKDGIYSVMSFPKIEIIGKASRDPSSAVYSGILWFKQKLRESIRNNFLPPQSLILEGTILGDNGAMSKELKDKLNITGLRHIIAVSGTHIIILSSIIMSILLAVGLWRNQAFYVSLLFIFTYIILTGLPASGIRAGIMGGLYLLAQKLGRQSMGSRVIAIACAAMLLINPLLLFYDVGFQLSFLAVMGLIYLEPLIKTFFKFIAKRFFNTDIKEKSESLISMVSTTLSAQIFTLPIMVYNFGNISYVSPITNFLVLPIVSFLMIFGFLSSLAGIFSNVLGQIFAIPCWVLLTYFVKIIDFFSQPWAMKVVQNVSWIWLVIFYLLIILLIRFLNKRYSLRVK